MYPSKYKFTGTCTRYPYIVLYRTDISNISNGLVLHGVAHPLESPLLPSIFYTVPKKLHYIEVVCHCYGSVNHPLLLDPGCLT